jgi:hypothetical protein
MSRLWIGGLGLALLVGPASGLPPAFPSVPIGETAWITSGVWVRDRLVLLDASHNRLAWLHDGKLDPLDPFLSVPTKVQALDPAGDLLVSSAEKAYWWEKVRLEAEGWTVQKSWSCETCGISDWTLVHDSLVFAVGDVQVNDTGEGEQERGHEEHWVTGLFWVTPDGPELAYELSDEDYPLYLHGFRLLAVVGGQGYAVVPEAQESTETQRRLTIIEVPRNQTTWRTLCRLPTSPPALSFAQEESFAATFEQVSALEGPVRLLSWESRLYLIQKTRQGFEVWKVDTDDGGLHFKQALPTSDFATVIPGPEHWAVVLKGAVTGFGKQTVKAVVLVEAERFR